MRAPLFPLAFLLVSLAAARGAVAQHPFEIGEPFPQVVLPTLDGEPTSIASFRGNRVALIMFASW